MRFANDLKVSYLAISSACSTVQATVIEQCSSSTTVVLTLVRGTYI